MKRTVLTFVLTLVAASMALSQGVDFGAHAMHFLQKGRDVCKLDVWQGRNPTS